LVLKIDKICYFYVSVFAWVSCIFWLFKSYPLIDEKVIMFGLIGASLLLLWLSDDF